MSLTRITDHLYFGNLSCCASDPAIAVVHACKHPCHTHAVGKTTSVHPHYLAFEQGNHLFLNLIDPPLPLFKKESFEIFLRFMEKRTAYADNSPPGKIIIHCNQGESRAPSLALLAMAKVFGTLPNETYAAARAAFEARFPYKPGKGIETFLTENWDAIKPSLRGTE